MQSDHAHATLHDFMLTASWDTGNENFVCHALPRRHPSFTASGARGARRSRRPDMRLSRLSSLTAIALTAGLLSQAHAVSVTRQEGNCSAVWDTGTAAATIGRREALVPDLHRRRSNVRRGRHPERHLRDQPERRASVRPARTVHPAPCPPHVQRADHEEGARRASRAQRGHAGLRHRRHDQPRSQARPEEHEQAAQEVQASKPVEAR